MFVYKVIAGQAQPLNNGPKLKGKFTKPFVHWDGISTPKERLGPPRGFQMSVSRIPTKSTPTKVTVNLTKLEDLNINPDLFIPMQAGTIFDKLISNDGGILPATNIMAAGAPGIGKTTILLDHLSQLQANGYKVLFISAEMNEMDMARYLKRFPSWATLPILFMNNYEAHANLVIEKALEEGYDVVLTDSYTEVNDTVKDHTGWTRGKAEKWFLDLMTKHNKSDAYTAFVTILQLSKGGQFVGSNKLKHMTTSMMKLDWEGNENGRRYLEFSKNRVGDVNKKLYFSFENGVQYNEARFTQDIDNDNLLKEEQHQLETEENAFDRIFGFNRADDKETEEHVEL